MSTAEGPSPVHDWATPARRPQPWDDLVAGRPREDTTTEEARRRSNKDLDREPHWAIGGKTVKWTDGSMREVFLIGALAAALGRQPGTIRMWEPSGAIPKPLYRRGRGISGRRRVYRRDVIEGLVRIAEEEGLLDNKHLNTHRTGFPRRAAALFEALR